MEYLLRSVICLLILIIVILAVRLGLMKKAAREIRTAFAEKLQTETNTLIGISSRDPEMRRLAADINVQLAALRGERRRFQHGDLELKEAVTNISHDLRTPLTAICGYLDLLSEETLPETARRYLSQIENRTEVMKQLTEELFRYSMVSSAPELSPEEMDLCRALEECLVSFYGNLQARSIVPHIEIPETRVLRYLDPTAVTRIFSNIISNALKYSSGDLDVSMGEDGTVIFSNTADNLDAVSAGRLFDRFYTVESGRNSTGLGLSIARLLTERMGGTISASLEGRRLSITVQFPDTGHSGRKSL